MKFVKQTLIPHAQNNYRPHLIRRHGLVFALLLILVFQLVQTLQINARPQVLGYATNITISGLLSGTNSERSAAGKSTLKLNSKLNSAAQAKANHMIENDYWSHTSPDGVTPWYWFDWAGYDYLVAGENLAYGFDTSNGVINGWMNSPSHRDNMLNGAFEDVGFGIADGANFQGGPNTVVVAMYGDPAVLSDSSSPPPSSTSPQQEEPAPEPAPEPTPEPKSEPAPEPEEPAPKEDEAPADEEETLELPEELVVRSEIAPSEPKRISNLEALLTGQAGWALYGTAFIALSIGFVYAYRHVLFIHQVVVKGEEFVLSHPMLEASIIYALIWLLLAGTFGSVL